MTPDQTVRLLRAKAGELEARVRDLSIHASPDEQDIAYLRADIALVAGLLADHIEATS